MSERLPEDYSLRQRLAMRRLEEVNLIGIIINNKLFRFLDIFVVNFRLF